MTYVTILKGAMMGLVGQLVDFDRVTIGPTDFKFSAGDYREATFEEICRLVLKKETLISFTYTEGQDDWCQTFSNNWELHFCGGDVCLINPQGIWVGTR